MERVRAEAHTLHVDFKFYAGYGLLQMARDDYEQRKQRQAAGIAEAKKQGRFKGRQADTPKHKLIVSLRQNHTLQETAKLAGCSVSLVKLVMRQYKAGQP